MNEQDKARWQTAHDAAIESWRRATEVKVEESEDIHADLRDAWVAAMATVATESYTSDLVYVEYNDQLQEEQLDELLQGGNIYEVGSFDEWESEARWSGVQYEMEHLMGSEYARDELWSAFPDFFDELRWAIEDKDRSDPAGELLSHMGSVLFQSTLEVEVGNPDSDDFNNTDEYRVDILSDLGLEPTPKNVAAIRELQAEQGWGYLSVLFYAPATDAVEAQVKGATIEGPQLALIDPYNGSGYEATFEGTITIKPGSIVRDESRGYGSMENICGLVQSAFAADLVLGDAVTA
nr:hypothetical protein [Rhodococcus sp. (in: high G+C Gram-positive bacteria)]